MYGISLVKQVYDELNDLSEQGFTSRRRDVGCYNDRIALIFDRHVGSGAA